MSQGPAEDPVPGHRDDDPEPRRLPSTIGGMFYLVILAVVAGSLLVIALGEWRFGVRLMAGAVLGAALLRMVLPRRDAGMLAVRHRLVDCLLLGALGGLLIYLAATIPNQPLQ